MPYDLTEPLVIGISSRALFNLEQENEIYEKQGLITFISHADQSKSPRTGILYPALT